MKQPATTTTSETEVMDADDIATSENDKHYVVTTESTDEILPPEPESMLSTFVGVMGNVLEWYDFALFGFFSDIIAQVFFPPEDPNEEHSNLVKSFAIFGGAFLMRPIGGLLIGYTGDKHGRKKALTRSLFLMAIPTTAMGILPTYERVGAWAIVLLIFCRLLQGLSVGGQLPASLVYTVEKNDIAHIGYYSSMPMMAANIGTLLGNLSGAFIRTILTNEQLLDWGWRVPFLSGFLIAFVACYIQRHGPDVHTNQQHYDRQDSKSPFHHMCTKENQISLVSASLAPLLWASGFYISFVWMAIYMETLLEPDAVNHAFWVNACSLFLGMTFMLPLAGRIADKMGHVKVMSLSAASLMVVGPLAVFLIGKTHNGMIAFLSQLVLGVLLSFFGAPLCAWLVISFRPEVRLTSAAIGYDLAHSVAGGFSPAFATLLFTHVGKFAPGMLYTIFGGLSLVGLGIQYFFGVQLPQSTSLEPKVDLELQPNSNNNATQELPQIS